MTARAVAREVLRRVEQGEAYASLALGGALERSGLSGVDRALATEIVYGVLRHRRRLDRALAQKTFRGRLAARGNPMEQRGRSRLSLPVLIALRTAAYQLLVLRVPAHAAVDEAVTAIRAVDPTGALPGFANAVLRRLAAEGEPPPPPATDVISVLEEVHSFPRWLGNRLVAAVGRDEAIQLAEAMNQPGPVALRVSLERVSRDEVAQRIAAEHPTATLWHPPATTHANAALLVRGAGAPETLSVFQEGLCTVQDVGAQMVGTLCGAEPGERILDACAGVGGKSTHLAQLARTKGGRAHVDAADLSRRKLDLCVDSARRLGLEADISPVVVDLTAHDLGQDSSSLASTYDRVLIDAPCSGLGVLRRHPEAKWRRRPADIQRLAKLQGRLLASLAGRVRPGGILVYSVCTFTEEEGPQRIACFLSEHPEFCPADETVRTWPHRHDADAFFAVRLRRASGKAG